MSTHGQIGIYESKEQDIMKPSAIIYMHSDAYPGKADQSEHGVLAEIVPFLRFFSGTRGLNDTEYLAAWLVHDLIDQHITRTVKVYARHEMYQGLDPRDCLGFGICDRLSGDISFYYRIYPNALEVYRVSCNVRLTKNNFTLLETVDLTPTHYKQEAVN